MRLDIPVAAVLLVALTLFVRAQFAWVVAEATRTDRPPLFEPVAPVGEGVCGPYNQRCDFDRSFEFKPPVMR